MITSQQIQVLAKKYKINQTVIFREYLQLWFLSQLYTTRGSQNILFKGGTAIHLLWGSFRFSEDLDFTVGVGEDGFQELILGVFKKVGQFEGVSIKPKKTLAGKSFLLAYQGELLPFKVFISLDFSFREKVLKPAQSALTTDFPLIFTGFIHHLAPEEILAEKIRAILTRNKGRDFFDLWFLLSKGIKPDFSLIQKKMDYYPRVIWNKDLLAEKINQFSPKEFTLDLRPFLSLSERGRTDELYQVARETISKKLFS